MLASSPLKIVVASILLLIPLLSQAEDMLPTSEAHDNQALPMPRQGQSLAEITSEFGKPRRTTQIDGEALIRTWHYEYFSVYFREDQVIHSVKRHRNLFTIAAD